MILIFHVSPLASGQGLCYTDTEGCAQILLIARERMYTSFSERLRIVYQKDGRFFNFERLCNLSERKIMQSFKIKESCNLSEIEYAIFLRKKCIL